MDLKEVNDRHVRCHDKYYRMYSGLASNIRSYENKTIELEINYGDNWPVWWKTLKGTAVQLVNNWLIQPELKDAERYIVHLYNTRGSSGFAFTGDPNPQQIKAELKKFEDKRKTPTAVIKGEINAIAIQNFVGAAMQKVVKTHPIFNFLMLPEMHNPTTLDLFDLDIAGLFFVGEKFFIENEPIISFGEDDWIYGFGILKLPENIGLLHYRFPGEQKYSIYGVTYNLSEHLDAICMEVIKEKLLERSLILKGKFDLNFLHGLYTYDSNDEEFQGWYDENTKNLNAVYHEKQKFQNEIDEDEKQIFGLEILNDKYELESAFEDAMEANKNKRLFWELDILRVRKKIDSILERIEKYKKEPYTFKDVKEAKKRVKKFDKNIREYEKGIDENLIEGRRQAYWQAVRESGIPYM